ncbi:hypothetical protein E6B08_23120 [Pseudomonas putida]|uniref:Uncharacterized protein n=1 Tax=Pseudomonas putida TaxID=303 RepID=A0A4D6XHZ5_PSEPU|nr:hypothetical protein [Pseudomonas putida]QCI14058.1 hypothetical protein E6B08_23120 [Pseudomonas putida]
MTLALKCIVKFDGAGFWTNTVKGKRASCTANDRTAAERLADRLFGEGKATVKQQSSEPGDRDKYIASRWLLTGEALLSGQEQSHA